MLEDKQRVLKQSHLQVETDPNAVTKIIEWFEQFSDGLVPEQFALQCKLVLAETFTAVVRLARQNLYPTTSTSFELKLFADYLEIRILEPGLPFHLPAHLLEHLAQPEVDDWDMRFVLRLIDERCYICLPDGRNYLVMRKRLVKDSKSQ